MIVFQIGGEFFLCGMLISVFAYTNIIHLLIDAVFLVHEMSTEPFNFYVEKVNAFF